jgi:membrane associated rhomboid family serine protease
VPLVGASGAVAGAVAAYVMLHPRVKLWVLLFMRIPLKISAMWAIGGWLLLQVANVFVTAEHSTAWWAHIGGFATGAFLIVILRRPGVPLFGRVTVSEPAER